MNDVADRCTWCPFLFRCWCEGGGGHLCFHRDKVHQWWIHERQRPGPQRLPRWDCGAAVAHQVPVLPAGAFPQVSHSEAPCVFPVVYKISCSSFNVRHIKSNTWRIEMCWIKWLILIRFVHWLHICDPSNHEEDHHRSIFTRCDNRQGFRLKENVQFHLYISTSPCGDARIFSPHEAGVEGERITAQRRTVQRSEWPDEDLTVIRNAYLTVRSSECLCLSSFLSQIRETDTRTERPAGSSAPRSSQVREPSRSAPVTPSRRGTGFFRGRGCSPCPAVTRSPGLFHRLLANTVNMNVNDINLCIQAVSEGETYNEYMGCSLSKWINMAIIWL